MPGQRRKRRPRRLLDLARQGRRPARDLVERPDVRSDRAGSLLRPGAAEPDLSLVDLGRDPRRRRADVEGARDDPGASLELADLDRPRSAMRAHRDTLRVAPRPWRRYGTGFPSDGRVRRCTMAGKPTKGEIVPRAVTHRLRPIFS